MANTGYLTSTLVMGILAAAVVALVLRTRHWRHYAPTAAYGLDGAAAPRSGLARVAGSTNTWTATFILLSLAVVGGVIASLSGAVSGMVMIGALGAALVAFLVAGVYVAMRENGRPSSQAAAGSAIVLGFLAVLAITALLLTGG